MCTAACYKTEGFYFGRTLDYEFSYGEEVVVTPRSYRIQLRSGEGLRTEYALIGMAHVENGYPLYYDAANECGLCMAGLNFVGNSFLREPDDTKTNIAQFELIPYILGKCKNLDEARETLKSLNITNVPFSDKMPLAGLHWIISDKSGSVTLESVREGIFVYDNPVGVLTNNPPFPMQMFNLNNYMSLSAGQPQNTFAAGLELSRYSRGMGALGLPGDLSSQSRFVRAAYVRMNSVSGSGEEESVSQLFHILGSVDQQRGCCEVEKGKYEITIYTGCISADKGIYYYTTYDNHRITGVDMHRENLDGEEIVRYPVLTGERIFMQN